RCSCGRPRWNAGRSRARTSSRLAIMSGSRWRRTGAAIARITRGETGLGPGPSSRRSFDGSMTQRTTKEPDVENSTSGSRRPGIAVKMSVNLSSPDGLGAAPVLIKDGPERLVQILTVAEEGFPQHAFLHGADFPQRSIPAAV